jgi:hypothetical protein
MVGKVDTAIVKALHNLEWDKKCAHLDACGGITPMSDSTAPTITHIQLTILKDVRGHYICLWLPCQEVQAMFLQNPSMMFKLNGKVLNKLSMDLYPNKKCVRLLRWFGNSGHEKLDMMLLSIEVSVIDWNTNPTF